MVKIILGWLLFLFGIVGAIIGVMVYFGDTIAAALKMVGVVSFWLLPDGDCELEHKFQLAA